MYNKEKEMALVKKEVELLRKEELFKVREELLKAREEVDRCRQALNVDRGEIEHNYHSARQVKETEIARLDALIEAKKAILEQDNNTILFLKGIIENLSKMHAPGEKK